MAAGNTTALPVGNVSVRVGDIDPDAVRLAAAYSVIGPATYVVVLPPMAYASSASQRLPALSNAAKYGKIEGWRLTAGTGVPLDAI